MLPVAHIEIGQQLLLAGFYQRDDFRLQREGLLDLRRAAPILDGLVQDICPCLRKNSPEMLQLRPDLDFNEPTLDVDDSVHRAITMAGLLTSIDHCRFLEDTKNERDDSVLFLDITYDDSASSDILKLAQTNAFALQFFYNGNRRFNPNARLQTQLAEFLHNNLLRLVKGSSEGVQGFNVGWERLAFPEPVSQSIHVTLTQLNAQSCSVARRLGDYS
jgi:hypothetical protein